MSLAHGRHYLAIPGPSVVPDRVLRAMHRPAPNIYTGELVEMVPGIVTDLSAVARTRSRLAIYISNGHGAWEAALANVLAPGDKALVLGTGRFAPFWGRMAGAMGVGVEELDFGLRATLDPDRVEDRLRADRDRAIRAILVVHVDTATGVKNDIAALRAAVDAAGHPAVLMVDCIASLACDDFRTDEWGADVMVAACQKGLMTPPGLAFVWFNDRGVEARGRLDRVSAYWDWRPRTEGAEFYQIFAGTAPTHHLYGLRAALDMIAEERLDAVLDRHARLAGAVWAAFEAWGQGGPLELNIADRAHRSHAVTAIRAGSEKGTALRSWLEHEAGVTLGIGLGMAPPGDPEWHHHFRVGHMGHVNTHMILGMLGAIEAGLDAVGIPHGAGALDAAIGALAGAGVPARPAALIAT